MDAARPGGGQFGDLGSADRYAYANDDPVNMVDPSGKCAGMNGAVDTGGGTFAVYINECIVQAAQGLLWMGAGAAAAGELIATSMGNVPAVVIVAILGATFAIGAGLLQFIDGIGGNQGIIEWFSVYGGLTGISPQ